MSSIYTDSCFLLSADLDLCFKLFISHVDCTLPDALGIRAEDVFVSARLIDGGVGLHSCSRATRSPVRSGAHAYFSEWLTFPVKIRDLPRTAQLVVSLIGPEFKTLGGSTVRCFDERSALKRGLQHVAVWPSVELAEAAAAAVDHSGGTPLVAYDGALEHLKRLEAFQLGELQASPWTDRLAFAQLRRELGDLGGAGGGGSRSSLSRLALQFPAFDFPVVYEDLSYHDAVAAATGGAVAPMIPPPPPLPPAHAGLAAAGPSSSGSTPTWFENSTLCVVADPEADVDNPCEAMYQVRGARARRERGGVCGGGWGWGGRRGVYRGGAWGTDACLPPPPLPPGRAGWVCSGWRAACSATP